MIAPEYSEMVDAIEGRLSPLSKKSFETWSESFVDGGEIFKHYHERWKTHEGKAALANRTPLQLERDRILYSPSLRKQAEKYHVLYNGQQRIVRSFATHTMRCAQVSRAIARGLSLNEDFAEAIALGSKVGATPFVHAAKNAVDEWLRETIEAIDKKCMDDNNVREKDALFDEDLPRPGWIERLDSVSTFEAVKKWMPWACGEDVDRAYSSGRQSYWSLCCNPFTVQAIPMQFQPETMFGIWRHSLSLRSHGTLFHHKIAMDGASCGSLEIIGKQHVTFESRVVQYADDITWAIENLDDANSTALLNDGQSVYEALTPELSSVDLPSILSTAIRANDAGGFYTFFITDFVEHSREILAKLAGDGGEPAREALGASKPEAMVGLSERGNQILEEIISFLRSQVFAEPRVRNRKDMLAEVSRQCVGLLYDGDPEALSKMIEARSVLEGWSIATRTRAKELLSHDVHRAQAAVTVFAGMADQEIYDFVGIQSL